MPNAYRSAIEQATKMRKKKFTGSLTGEERLAGSALPQEGKWTATQTGAKDAARLRAGISNAKQVMGAASDTKSFEDLISGKGRK